MDSASAVALLDLAEELSPGMTGPNAADSIEGVDARSDEMVAAIAWFVDAGRSDEALRLANALYRLWIVKRRFEEGDRVFTQVLESGAGDPRLRARAFLHAGFMPFWMGDDGRAGSLFGQSLELARRLVDAPLISQALGGFARVALRTDVPEGRRLAHEALDVSEAADDEAGRSNALHLLGVGAQIAGDLFEARRWMAERLALVRSLGNDFLVASEAANLSMVERQLGNLDVAAELDREALVVGGRIGDEFTKPFAIAGLAAIATDRGKTRAGRNPARRRRDDDGVPAHGVAAGRAAALRADARRPPRHDGRRRIRARAIGRQVDVPSRCRGPGPHGRHNELTTTQPMIVTAENRTFVGGEDYLQPRAAIIRR